VLNVDRGTHEQRAKMKIHEKEEKYKKYLNKEDYTLNFHNVKMIQEHIIK